jgi:outer membrane protein OmpA-like peptidoglycan-associated protein
MKYLSILILLSVSLSAGSQTKIISRSDFETTDGWGLIDDANATFRVSNGYYMLTHKRTTSGWQAAKSAGIEPEKDFYVEAKFIHKEGVTNYKYGFYLKDQRRTNANKQHYLAISANQSFVVYSYDYSTKKSTYHQEWKEMKEVIKGEEDILAIKKSGAETIFYINETEVFRTDVEFYGSSVGFVVDNKQSVWIDYVLVKQDREDILLAEGYDMGYQAENLGDHINSEYDDLAPIISADEKTLYISRKDHPDNMGDEKKSDIWYSVKNNIGEWMPMKNIGTPLNNDGYNYVISITPDNNTLFLANTYHADGSVKGSGLSVSRRTGSGWEVPVTITIDDFYNDNKYGDFCFSTDRKVLIMSCERNDTHGERDLYVSFYTDSNHYSSPVNMGTVINSFASENNPFIAADNNTLYYSSSGKPGYGNSDVFVTKRLDETWTRWSAPRNMGPDINTSGAELTYAIPASGTYAYLVSNKLEGRKGDIYRIQVPASARPDPVVLIRGKILNSKTNEPLASDIIYTNLATNKEAGTALSHPSTGEYQIVLPFGVNYGIQASRNGFYPLSENIDLTRLEKYTEIEKDLYLSPLEQGAVIRLNNIFFDFNKSDLLPESYNELDKLISILNENPGFVIEISGHTDNAGSESYNYALSKKRAEGVVKYLKEKGVKNSLTPIGYGMSKPIAGNDSEEGRKTNRRVEFTISQ